MGPVPGDAAGGGAGSGAAPEATSPTCGFGAPESQEGDYSAFDALVTKHRGRVYAMIQNMVKNEADSWDLAQEVFVKVWKALPKFEARARFSTWMYRITHNVVYDWMRKRKIETSRGARRRPARATRADRGGGGKTTPVRDMPGRTRRWLAGSSARKIEKALGTVFLRSIARRSCFAKSRDWSIRRLPK